jgi:hypothetical protein
LIGIAAWIKDCGFFAGFVGHDITVHHEGAGFKHLYEHGGAYPDCVDHTATF